MDPTLAYVTADPPSVRRTAYVLHGILGSKSNWRTLARRYAERLDGWGFVVVDLRMHGDSQGFAAPHTLAAVADDLARLSRSLGRPADAVIGHSFGAKSALGWLAAGTDPLRRAVILDTNPGARPDGRGSEGTLAVLDALCRAGQRFATREVFIQGLTDGGVSAPIAQWLAMNLVVDGDGYRLRLDLRAIDALLDDYFAQDLWSVLEPPAAGVAVDFVVGGRSDVLAPEDLARLERAAQAAPEQLRVTVLPAAGHWVHVDDPAGVSSVILDALRR